MPTRIKSKSFDSKQNTVVAISLDRCVGVKLVDALSPFNHKGLYQGYASNVVAAILVARWGGGVVEAISVDRCVGVK